jgi:hypothetical protein
MFPPAQDAYATIGKQHEVSVASAPEAQQAQEQLDISNGCILG